MLGHSFDPEIFRVLLNLAQRQRLSPLYTLRERRCMEYLSCMTCKRIKFVVCVYMCVCVCVWLCVCVCVCVCVAVCVCVTSDHLLRDSACFNGYLLSSED